MDPQLHDEQLVFAIASQVLLFVVLIGAAVTDLRDRKVYNWLTYPGICFGMTLAWANGSLSASLIGFSLAVTVWLFGVWVGKFGFGDLKLVAAVGAIQGYPFIIPAMFWTSVVGMIIALGKLAMDGVLLKGIWSSARYAVSFSHSPEESEDEKLAEKKIPYGVAISFGTLLAWFLEVLLK